MMQPAGMKMPVTVMKASTKRESGKKAQIGNIMAAKVNSSLSSPD